MTSFQVVYDAFMAKILEDEWQNWLEEEIAEDFRMLLEGAIPQFKFPRISLDRTDAGFNEDLTNEEIQILATYMKCEWLNRTLMTWENVKPLYDERDFSQANLIAKFEAMLDAEQKKAARLEAKYYRAIKYKPFDYEQLGRQDWT